MKLREKQKARKADLQNIPESMQTSKIGKRKHMENTRNENYSKINKDILNKT